MDVVDDLREAAGHFASFPTAQWQFILAYLFSFGSELPSMRIFQLKLIAFLVIED